MNIFSELSTCGIDCRFDTKNRSSLKAGGKLAAEVLPESTADLKRLYEILRGYDNVKIVGAMSNILVRDEGFAGVAIGTSRLKSLEIIGDCIYVSGGESLPYLLSRLTRLGFSGAEALSGIPSTVGGAIAGNAGAFGLETAELVEQVSIFDFKSGKNYTLSQKEMGFSYRSSALIEGQELVLGAKLRLVRGDPLSIAAKCRATICNRKELHPNEPSLGCTFKRVGGVSAGKLIDDCGLKGLAIGGAAISEKHAGFIVNHKECLSSDYIKLAEIAKKAVKSRFNLDLQYEIKIL